jgi:hypothetical protein
VRALIGIAVVGSGVGETVLFVEFGPKADGRELPVEVCVGSQSVDIWLTVVEPHHPEPPKQSASATSFGIGLEAHEIAAWTIGT